jgi:hypothetical protein
MFSWRRWSRSTCPDGRQRAVENRADLKCRTQDQPLCMHPLWKIRRWKMRRLSFSAYSTRKRGIVKVEADLTDRNALPIFPVFLLLNSYFARMRKEDQWVRNILREERIKQEEKKFKGWEASWYLSTGNLGESLRRRCSSLERSGACSQNILWMPYSY